MLGQNSEDDPLEIGGEAVFGPMIDGEGYRDADLDKFLKLLDERFAQFQDSPTIPKGLCWLCMTAMAALMSPERQYQGRQLERMDDAYERVFTTIELGLFPPEAE
ncbi:MAG TPA: hypothetical protein VGM98_06870 [Schlesneria sp.]